MPAKTKTDTKKTATKTTSDEVKKPAVKSSKTSNSKITSPKQKLMDREQDTSVIAETVEKPLKPRKVKISRKVLYAIAGILGLVLLALVINKFLVIAWVNNKPISWFEYYKNLDKRYGKDLKEELIVEKLLVDEGKSKGINLNDSEVDAEIQKIETEQGGKEKFDEILTAQGISRPDLKKLVGLQLIRKKLFEKDATVSAEEVEKYIQDNKSQLPEVDDKLRQNIKDQLTQQKASESFNKWLSDAVNSSKVIRH
jgi:parvulin-like peptidyl-prolyl isomerase